MSRMGFVFVSRNWETDKKKIQNVFKFLKGGKEPFLLFTHPEGSRIDEEKKKNSHKFAEERGLPKLENMLLPRTKGFCSTIEALAPELAAVYDFTIAYTRPPPAMLSVSFKWGIPDAVKKGQVHVLIKRYPISDLPRDPKAQETWLYNLYSEKDKLITQWHKTKEFPGIRWKPTKVLTLSQTITNYFVWIATSLLPLVAVIYAIVKLLSR